MRATQPAGLVVALAQSQRPGGRQQQPRPAVEFLGRQAVQPFEHAALVAVRHQRFVEAAFGQFVGAVGLARGQRVAGRVDEQAVRGQPIRGAAVQPSHCSCAVSTAKR